MMEARTGLLLLRFVLGFSLVYVVFTIRRLLQMETTGKKLTMVCFMLLGLGLASLSAVPLYWSYVDTLQVQTDAPVLLTYVTGTNALFLTGLRSIDMSFTAQQPWYMRLYFSQKDALGTYSPLTREISIIGEYLLSGNRDDIWWHELGHHIWFTYVTPAERATYTAIYNASLATYLSNDSIAAWQTGFVSQYATENVREDFADAFAYWVDDALYTARGRTYWRIGEGASRVALLERVVARVGDCTGTPACVRVQKGEEEDGTSLLMR